MKKLQNGSSISKFESLILLAMPVSRFIDCGSTIIQRICQITVSLLQVLFTIPSYASTVVSVSQGKAGSGHRSDLCYLRGLLTAQNPSSTSLFRSNRSGTNSFRYRLQYSLQTKKNLHG